MNALVQRRIGITLRFGSGTQAVQLSASARLGGALTVYELPSLDWIKANLPKATNLMASGEYGRR